MPRLLGHLPDEHPAERPRLAALLGAAPAAPPASADLSAHVLDVLDQGNQDCVANAVAQALRMALSSEGVLSPALCSRRLVYWQARRANALETEDKGSRPWSAYEALRLQGYAVEGACPYDPAAVLEAPPPEVYRHAYDQIGGLVAYRLPDDGGDEVVSAVQAALGAGHPVTLALEVDQSFLDGSFLGPWTKTGLTIGGHYVCATGYNDRGVRFVNSWGTGWQEHGFSWLSWATIGNAAVCRDLYAVTALRPPSDSP